MPCKKSVSSWTSVGRWPDALAIGVAGRRAALGLRSRSTWGASCGQPSYVCATLLPVGLLLPSLNAVLLSFILRTPPDTLHSTPRHPSIPLHHRQTSIAIEPACNRPCQASSPRNQLKSFPAYLPAIPALPGSLSHRSPPCAWLPGWSLKV